MVPSKDDGTSKVYTNSPAVELIVIPTPDGNDTVMESLLLRSMKVDDIVTLSPTEATLSDISVPLRLMRSGSLLLIKQTYKH